MPFALIEKMEKIHETNSNLMESYGERARFFSQGKGPSLKIEDIPENSQGRLFMEKAQNIYNQQGVNPPYTLEKVNKMYELFQPIGKDLTGDPNGTEQEKALAKEWEGFWNKYRTEYINKLKVEHKKNNPSITTEQMNKILEEKKQEIDKVIEERKQEIIKGYRFKIISLSKFMPSDVSNTMNEGRIQTFFVEVNSNSALSSQECLNKVNQKLQAAFEGKSAGRSNADQWIAYSKERETEFLGKSREVLLEGLQQAKKGKVKEDIAKLKQALLAHPQVVNQQKSSTQKFFDAVGRFFNEKGRRREAFREAMRGELPKQNSTEDKEKITDVIKKITNLKKNESLQEVLLPYQKKELDKLEKSLSDAQKTSQKRYVDPMKLERLAMKKLDEMVIDISLRSQGEVTDIGVIQGIDFRSPEQIQADLKRQKIAGPLLEKTLLSIGVTGHDPKGLLKISPKEWLAAKTYFEQHPEETQLKKKNKKQDHSFVKVTDGSGKVELYAMANKNCVGERKYGALGQGAFGKVKVIQNEQGECFAGKIEGVEAGMLKKQKAALQVRREEEIQIMEKMGGYFFGQTTRQLTQPKQFLDSIAEAKIISVLKLVQGQTISQAIKSGTFEDEPAKLMAALKICRQVREFHDKGIVHRDLKPDNMMVDKNGEMVLIDVGLSKLVPEGAQYIARAAGTGSGFYMAPEIQYSKEQNMGTYSFYSDIYALGQMFLDTNSDMAFGFSKEIKNIFTKMTDKTYHNRISLDEVMLELVVKLKEGPEAKKNPTLMQELDNIALEIKSHQKTAEQKLIENIAQAKTPEDIKNLVLFYQGTLTGINDKPILKSEFAQKLINVTTNQNDLETLIKGPIGFALKEKMESFKLESQPEVSNAKRLTQIMASTVPSNAPSDTLLPLDRPVPPFVPSGANVYPHSPQKLTKLDLMNLLQDPPFPSTDTTFNYIRQRAAAGQQQLAMGSEVSKVIKNLRNEISVAKEIGPSPVSHPSFDKKLNEFVQKLDDFESKLKNNGITQAIPLVEETVRKSNQNNKYK